ncbi:MAG TPA: Xaa-Pro peptidase family protein [Ktedonobacterales bacterium]|nr:Xaa-Pro peptidase family protein [Ktedonobacterales bacterium]
MSHDERVDRLRQTLRAQELDGLLVSNPENRRYLSGFTGHDDREDSAGVLLVGLSDLALLTDGRYAEVAAAECPGLRVAIRKGPMPAAAVALAAEIGIRRLGVEARHLTIALRQDLEAAEGAAALELVATRNLLEAQRAIKDDDELAAIARAVAITDATMAHLLTFVRPGMAELAVADEIARYLRAQGSDGMAFDPIVAGGPNAALPHAVPSARPLEVGETIVVDMGARYAGYCADMTRTICLGDAPERVRQVYAAVQRSLEACEAGLRAGITGQAADAMARESLGSAGFGEYFVHGTGHGLGLEIHEDPRLGAYAADHTLAPNMPVTVEPGVYIPGWGGVRIEDTVVVLEGGMRRLTQSPKQLVVPLT